MNRGNRGSRWSAYHTAVAVAIGISIIYAFNRSNSILLAFSIALSPMLVFGALVTAILTVIKIGVRREDRITVVWFSFMLALFLWFLSSLVFSWYPAVLGMAPPYPSLADALDLAAYLPFMFGLLILIWPFREVFARWKVRGVLAVVAIVSMFTLSLMLPPILRGGQGFAGVFVSVAYPILDAIALSIAVLSSVIFMRGTFWRPCLLLVIGLVIASAADIYSGWANLSGTYYLGHYLELLFDFAFLSVALGFYLRRKQYLTKSA